MSEPTSLIKTAKCSKCLLSGFLVLIPILAALVAYLSNVNTRLTVIERVIVTTDDLDGRLRFIIKDELRPILQSHEERIRILEIKAGN